MKKILFLFMVLVPVSAIAGGGYYEVTTSDCSASGMRAALDRATVSGRAVTTVVKCNAGAGAGAGTMRADSQNYQDFNNYNNYNRPIVVRDLCGCDCGC